MFGSVCNSFEFVHKFPQQFARIDILNNPVALLPANSQKDTVRSPKLGNEEKESVHRRDYPVATILAIELLRFLCIQ